MFLVNVPLGLGVLAAVPLLRAPESCIRGWPCCWSRRCWGGVVFAVGTSRAVLLGDLALLGVGQGVFSVPFFTAALHRVRPAETGSAAGMLNAVQQLGATLGTAALGSIFLHVGGLRGGNGRRRPGCAGRVLGGRDRGCRRPA